MMGGSVPASAAALIALIGFALIYWALTGLGALKPKDSE
jgi:hypothetical protein